MLPTAGVVTSSAMAGDSSLKHRVLRSELVAMNAVGFGAMSGGDCVTAQQVDLSRDSLQVFGVNAIPNTTKMVNVEAERDSALHQRVTESMGTNCSIFCVNTSVTASLKSGDPNPVPIRTTGVDVHPKALNGGGTNIPSGHVSIIRQFPAIKETP